VECHEKWHYHDEEGIQELTGLIALCPACHRVKHLGRQFAIGKAEGALRHLSKVNQWPAETVERYVIYVFEVHKERSRWPWELDLSWLESGDYDF
jgi:hypothetical protein